MNKNIALVRTGLALALAWLAAPQAHAATIRIGTVELRAGESGTFDVTLATDGDQIAGTDNRIDFDSATQIVECTVNPSIHKDQTVFAFEPFLPPGCSPGSSTNPCTGCTPGGDDCEDVRALVLSLGSPTAIRNNSRLYTCTVNVAEGTPDGTYPLMGTGCEASDPRGHQPGDCSVSQGTTCAIDDDCPSGETCVPHTTCTDGAVIVSQQPVPTATETPGGNGGGGGGGGDCSITAAPGASHAWALLGPAALLFAARRRLRRAA